jgi:hypothetical protein
VLGLMAVMRMTDDEKDLEIMLLRQQLRIVERNHRIGTRRKSRLNPQPKGARRHYQ